MFRKENFILGENIKSNVYSYDDQGTEYIRKIEGKVCQITDSFVVIDNGKYKESFKYSEFEKCTPGNIENEPYDLALNTYKEDIIKDCVDDLNKKGKGFVFTKEEVDTVLEIMNYFKIEGAVFTMSEEDGIYIITKK